MPRPVEIRGELRHWMLNTSNMRVRGYVYDDKTGFYEDGSRITVSVKSYSEYVNHFIIKTNGSAYIAYKSQMNFRDKLDDD